MASPFELSGPMMPPASGRQPKHIILMLHGYGSDGNDLIGLAPHWSALLPDAVFVSPHAPFPCEMGHGHQWYGFANDSPERRLAGVRAAAPILNGFIDDMLTRFGLSAGNLALVGFSQGTMMSLHVAPRRAEAIAGVVGFSGAMNAPELLATEVTSRPPVVLIHGTADQVVPHESMNTAARTLTTAGIAVETHSRPGLPHSIDEEGLRLGGAFLRRVLSV